MTGYCILEEQQQAAAARLVALHHAGADALLADADAAVYRAKAAGGGRVELVRRRSERPPRLSERGAKE